MENSLDVEPLIFGIQVLSLILISIQSLPQIWTIYQEKEKAVENLSLGSWIAKNLFTLFFVATLFAGQTTLIIVLTQIVNLTMSMIILAQIVYYSHIEIVPTVHGNLVVIANPILLEKEEVVEYSIPVLHNLLKQIYVIGNFNLLPKLAYS